MITRLGSGGCECCGDIAWIWNGRDENGERMNARCRRHEGRNPCAIEGCRKTARMVTGYANDMVLCGEHWRRHFPKGSRARVAYNAHLRRARRFGWTDETYAAFGRLWDLIVARARRQSTEGRLDVDEINKLFGWEDAA